MKVLFTGMASSHCTRPSNVTFFRTLSDVISEFAEVTWAAPKLSWTKEDVDAFDVIIFGLTPPTALGANKIYGAMHLLGMMYHSHKLRLVVDSPQMWQYKNSLEAIKRDVSYLFSPFYSKRVGYSQLKRGEGKKYIELAASYIASGEWPETYYPSLPWNTDQKVAESLGFLPSNRLTGLNLDSFLILPEPLSASSRSNLWSVEDAKRTWFSTAKKALRHPEIDVKSSKLIDDMTASNLIRQSVGLIVPPQDRKTGTWWSYRAIQALNSGTPVVTQWQESQHLDLSWAQLAYQVEDMGEAERRSLSRDQLESYLGSIKAKTVIIEELRQEMIESSKERIKYA